MLKSENIQKSDKAPKVISKDTFFKVKTLFLDLMACHLILFTIRMTAQLYNRESESPYYYDKVKMIGHDTGYFHKYFTGFGFHYLERIAL